MKKFGFTLMELLITLGIIGIVAALAAPALKNLVPDKEKVLVMKYYNKIDEITTELMNDERIYYITRDTELNEDGVEVVVSAHGCDEEEEDGEWVYRGLLNCTGMPEVAPYNTATYSAGWKYPNLLLDKLGADLPAQGVRSATMPDGVLISIFAGDNNGFPIVLDVNGNDNGDNCAFPNANANGVCDNPDRFSFIVSLDGNISGNDPLTRAYIENSQNMNARAQDLARAEEIRTEDQADIQAGEIVEQD